MADGAVLFHAPSETYFRLNAVGATVWTMMSGANPSLNDVHAALSATYPDVPVEQIASDVQALLQELLAQGLVEGTVQGAGHDTVPGSAA